MFKTQKYRLGMMVIFTIIPFLFNAQKNRRSLSIQINHSVNDKILVLDDSTYLNSFGQEYTISKFNYYIGKIKLHKESGEIIEFNDYHLITEEKPSSKSFDLKNVQPGKYKLIEFILGVDSIDNCSGAQSDDLDPIYGMFWTWNTGYIFLKLEGNSIESTAVGNTLEYHIGGYKTPTNSIRTIQIIFEEPLVIVGNNKDAKIELNVSIDKLLHHTNTIDFSVNPILNTPLQASLIADNYQYIFELINVINAE